MTLVIALMVKNRNRLHDHTNEIFFWKTWQIIFIRSQAFFPYLNAAGYDFDDFDRFSEAKDGVAKKKLQKNECLEHYMESFQKKVCVLFVATVLSR